MGYVLRALVGRRSVIEHACARAKGVLVDLPQGYALLPLMDDDYPVHGDTPIVDDTFYSLTHEVARLAVETSHNGPVGYLEVEFFGGTGQQASMVWRDGAVVLGPLLSDNEYGQLEDPISEWAVNKALRYLGVQQAERDEFDALGLGRHRATEEWLEDA